MQLYSRYSPGNVLFPIPMDGPDIFLQQNKTDHNISRAERSGLDHQRSGGKVAVRGVVPEEVHPYTDIGNPDLFWDQQHSTRVEHS